MLNIYLLHQIDGANYDEFNGFVIAAETEKEAQEMANKSCGDEGKIWGDPEIVITELIGYTDKVVITTIFSSDFKAG